MNIKIIAKVSLFLLLLASLFAGAFCGDVPGLAKDAAIPKDLSTPESQKTRILEECRERIQYYLSNIGKDTQKLDVRRGGERMLQVRRIGAGFIAAEYLDCGNYVRAGEYYYRDWQDFKERREKWELEAAGDEYPLANYISVLEQMNRYSDAIKYYPEYLNEIRNRAELPKGVGAKEFREKSPVLADWYAEVDSAYRKAIMLSKTATPRPPDPAVQHHEWFYSGKPEEVLKSLDYYSQNKVQFMLEKALNHKNMAIAAKANEYLDNLTDSTDRGR